VATTVIIGEAVPPLLLNVQAAVAIALEVVVVVVVGVGAIEKGGHRRGTTQQEGAIWDDIASTRVESPSHHGIARGLLGCAAELVGVGGGGRKFEEEEARRATTRRRRAITTNTSSHQRILVTTTAMATAQCIDGSINANSYRAVYSRWSLRSLDFEVRVVELAPDVIPAAPHSLGSAAAAPAPVSAGEGIMQDKRI
jgi:hypothetical protein